MSKYFYKIVSIPFFLMMQFTLLAQRAEGDMADVFRSEGKIYVVIGVFVIIMVVLFIYLFMMDRKIRRLEDMMNNKD